MPEWMDHGHRDQCRRHSLHTGAAGADRGDEFKGAWRAIGRIAPDRLSGLRRVVTIESIGSSTRLEAARLSGREVERLLANLKIGSFATRDEQEVAGYAEVMETIFGHFEDTAPTENHIRRLHRDLLIHNAKDERHRGAYKTLANHVVAFDEAGRSPGVVFATATPFETPLLMAELVGWVRARGGDRSACAAGHRSLRGRISRNPRFLHKVTPQAFSVV